jgi:hypothetical protein
MFYFRVILIYKEILEDNQKKKYAKKTDTGCIYRTKKKREKLCYGIFCQT